jgi:hypothetical protein
MNEQYQGPVMLSVTNILRPPPARIGRISDRFILPRTIELRVLIAVGVGAFAGLVAWFFPVGLLFDYSLTSLASLLLIGLGLGYITVTWSPLKGESLGTWIGLSAGASRPGKVRFEGQKVYAYLGVSPLGYLAAGKVRIRPGAVTVPAGSVDERGVPHSKNEITRILGENAARQLAFPSA